MGGTKNQKGWRADRPPPCQSEGSDDVARWAILDSIIDWVATHPEVFLWGGVISAVTVIVPVLVGPLVLARLPADYFDAQRDMERAVSRHPYLRMVGVAFRNVVGGGLVLVGLLLTVLPGQGILTILAGLTVMTFPAKRRWMRKLLRKPPVRGSIDWMRRRMGSEPFLLDDERHSAV